MPPPPRRPEHAHHSLVKKKDEYIARLEEGKIKIKPNIQRIDGEKITFVDQTVMENCDAIIFCTGYNLTFPFIDDASLLPGIEAGRLDLYKKVFHPLHPTLAFIAHIDAIGSIFAISEMQSRWVAKVCVQPVSDYHSARDLSLYVTVVTCRSSRTRQRCPRRPPCWRISRSTSKGWPW